MLAAVFVGTAALAAVANGYILPQARTEVVVSVEGDQPARTMQNGCEFFDSPQWVLDCSGRGLNALPDSGLYTMRKAVHMWFGNNQIGDLTVASFSGNNDVEFLFLENNNIASIEQGTFAGMRNLRLLSLGGNRLGAMPPDVFNLAHLFMLDVRSNQIATVGPNDLPAQSETLRYLNLAGNAIGEVKCGTFNVAPGMMHLDMTGNPSMCGYDPVTFDMACECAEFGKAALLGGLSGYCSDTCSAGVVTAPTRPAGVSRIYLSHSADKTLDLLRGFDSTPNFKRYQVEASGADAVVVTSDSSDMSAVIAVASVFLAAAFGFAGYSAKKSWSARGIVTASSHSESDTHSSVSSLHRTKGWRVNAAGGGGYAASVVASTHLDVPHISAGTTAAHSTV